MKAHQCQVSQVSRRLFGSGGALPGRDGRQLFGLGREESPGLPGSEACGVVQKGTDGSGGMDGLGLDWNI